MQINCEKIGVDEKGLYKWHCPACHNIVLSPESESLSCPACEWKSEEDNWRLGTIVIYYFVACGVLLNFGVIIFLGLLWFFNYSR